MLPLRDDNPTQGTAWVTLALIALNVAAFLLWEPTFASGPGAAQRQEVFFFCQAEIPWEVTHQTTLGRGGAAARVAPRTRFMGFYEYTHRPGPRCDIRSAARRRFADAGSGRMRLRTVGWPQGGGDGTGIG